MQPQGLIVFNSTLPISTTSPQVYSPNGFQGVIVMTSKSGFDPALTPVTVNLVAAMSGGGSSLVLANSSKVVANNALTGPLYFPAGQYVVQTGATGSSIVGLMVSIVPTP